ncbi:MAG: VanW family protein [Chloroflexota bacterium]
MQNTIPFPANTPKRIRRTTFDFALIFLMLSVVTLLVILVFWQFWHANRIFTGVRIASIPVGGMTRIEAVNELNREIQPYPLPPVSLTYQDTVWPLPELSIRSGQAASNPSTIDLPSAVNRAYLTGREGKISTKMQDQLVALLVGINVEPQISFDRAQLRQLLSQKALNLQRPARSQQEIGDVTVPAQNGLNVDVEMTLQLLLEALRTNFSGNRPIRVPFVVQEVAPQSPNVEPQASGPVFELQSTPAMVLQSNAGLEIALDPATLASLRFSEFPPRLERSKLTALLNEWASRINIEPRDARLQFNPSTRTVSVLQSSQSGLSLNVEETANSIEAAFSAGNREAVMIIDRVPPAVDMNKIPEMGIRELVASGTTYFGGSSPARVRNIEVAAEKFEGAVIPPGQIFSFNKLIEDVSSANGFEDSLIIWGDQTAVGVGGGVCQVSTTVFRAAFEAGLPIVERYNHGYVVSWYGDPGLDATIYTPTVDFKFRNDTETYLLIDPIVDSANGQITFNFYGTKLDRQVTISEPVVTEVTQPEPPTYRVDPELATGVQEQVEWEKEGMVVEVTRTIVDGDGGSRTDTITSTYQPWKAVYLVGPGSPILDTLQEAEDSDGAGTVTETD